MKKKGNEKCFFYFNFCDGVIFGLFQLLLIVVVVPFYLLYLYTTFYSKYFKTWMNEWNSMTFSKQQQQQQQWLHNCERSLSRFYICMSVYITHILTYNSSATVNVKYSDEKTRGCMCVREMNERNNEKREI